MFCHFLPIIIFMGIALSFKCTFPLHVIEHLLESCSPHSFAPTVLKPIIKYILGSTYTHMHTHVHIRTHTHMRAHTRFQ